jgi:tyrosyl-tRNA synthetase
MVHGEEEYNKAVEASGILFGNSTSQALKNLDEQTFLSVFDGVPQFDLPAEKLGSNILDLLAVETTVFPSKGECRKMIQANGLSINKEKFTDANAALAAEHLVNGKYILVQKGKKNYFILKFN